MNSRTKSLTEFLTKHASEGGISFHMPGHKGARFFEELGYGSLIRSLADFDITEIEGADNLFQPESVLLRIMEKYKELYGSEKTYISIGGSSNALMASIMAVCDSGSGILIARNSHKSVYNGAALAGASVKYVFPETVPGWEIAGEIKPEEVEKILSEDSGSPIKAVVVTSPNYYGVLSDIRGIADVCHRYGAVLIVDQAHGAHLKMMDADARDVGSAENLGLAGADAAAGDTGEAENPGDAETLKSAENLGADIVINSTHKTLASFTQTAVVNVMRDAELAWRVGEKLEILESSSPSYILMASLDMNADILVERGAELIKAWNENLDYFYEEARTIPGLTVMNSKDGSSSLGAPRFDRTKILMDMRELGIGGDTLARILMNQRIFPELWDSNLVMAMTGIGNRREDYEKLLGVLRTISESHEELAGRYGAEEGICAGSFDSGEDSVGDSGDSSEGENEAEKGLLYWEDAAGLAAGSNITPYPPGVPLIVKGEIMQREDLEKAYALRLRGHKVIGMNSSGFVRILR